VSQRKLNKSAEQRLRNSSYRPTTTSTVGPRAALLPPDNQLMQVIITHMVAGPSAVPRHRPAC